MTRHCSQCKRTVRAEDAEIITAQETGSGAPVPVYACLPCIREYGLVPRPRFIGRRYSPPVAPVGFHR